jgi:hypothetical protein
MEYEVLIKKYGYKVQEMYTVQDHPPSPSEFLLLPPLDTLYKVYVRNQELPQPGDSRQVIPPSQRARSHQMIKIGDPRKHTKVYQLKDTPNCPCTYTPQTIEAKSTEDLHPLPLVNNDHVSVVPFEMYRLESGEPPFCTLNWKPLGFLSHIKCRTNDDRFPLSL